MAGSFFEEERERLIEDISKGFEDLINQSNVLNRKLEEVHGIGKEFTTVANLWGRFDELVGKVEPNTESAIPGTGRPVNH